MTHLLFPNFSCSVKTAVVKLQICITSVYPYEMIQFHLIHLIQIQFNSIDSI